MAGDNDTSKQVRKKTPGRKKADYKTQQEENEIFDAWKELNPRGTAMVDFAKDKDIKLGPLKLLIDRVRRRRSRRSK
jgi:hypothetical protein